jgi:hypothetical protein
MIESGLWVLLAFRRSGAECFVVCQRSAGRESNRERPLSPPLFTHHRGAIAGGRNRAPMSMLRSMLLLAEPFSCWLSRYAIHRIKEFFND